MSYFEIKPSIYADSGIQDEPRLPRTVSFMQGHLIGEPLPALEFESNSTEDEPPQHFDGISIPVMSAQLVECLERCGVSNLQRFEATLHNDALDLRWAGFFAVNVIGMVPMVSRAASSFVEVGRRPNGESLLAIDRLVVRKDLALQPPLCRLAEAPQTILIRADVLNQLHSMAPASGWGFSQFEVEEE